MKKSKYTEEQIIGTLKQMEAGRAVKDLARELGCQRSDDLHLEVEVWWPGGERSAAAA